ncbi:MAG TPA: CHRD domain-containing protein [Burkholderiales bacterium]|nr:CHRD domain-containing protein [Burkholderiales bacterium]
MTKNIWKTGGILAALMMAGIALAGPVAVKLSGDQEVPPVTTSGAGSGTITIGDDGSVSGSVTTTGVPGTMAHIHEGAPGTNGGVAIPLEKKGENGWAVPAGAKLSDAQMKAFKAGNLYVNVHTEKNKGGEVRGQLKP